MAQQYGFIEPYFETMSRNMCLNLPTRIHAASLLPPRDSIESFDEPHEVGVLKKLRAFPHHTRNWAPQKLQEVSCDRVIVELHSESARGNDEGLSPAFTSWPPSIAADVFQVASLAVARSRSPAHARNPPAPPQVDARRARPPGQRTRVRRKRAGKARALYEHHRAVHRFARSA